MRPATSTILLAAATAAVFVAACDSDGGVASPQVELLTIALSVPQAEPTANRSFQIVARVTNARGEVHAVPLIWDSDAPDIANVDRNGTVWTHRAGLARISASLDDVADHSAPVAVATLRVVDEVAFVEIIGPASTTLRRGETIGLQARARSGDGTVLEREVIWTSSDPAVATVAADGTVTAMSAGLVLVSAQAERRIASLTLRILEPVASVLVTPGEQLLGLGQEVRLAVTLRCEAGTPLVDRTVTWVSDAPSVVVVTADGRIVGVGEGTAVVTATAEGVSGAALVTVKADVGSIRISPAAATLAPGRMLTLSANVQDADGAVLQRAVSWASSDTAVAQVQAGTVLGRRDGVATITATAEGVVGAAEVTVVDPNVRIELPMGPLVVEEGGSLALEVVVTDSEGRVVQRAVTWSVDDVDVATAVEGVLRGHKPGATVLEARVDDHVARVGVEVVPPRVARITVTPSAATLAVGETVSLRAVAVDTRGRAVSDPIVWRSANEDVVQIDDTGMATAVGGGSTQIRAQSGLYVGTAIINVLGAGPVDHITITRTAQEDAEPIRAGTTEQLVATAYDVDATVIPGVQFTWSSNAPSVATVDGDGLVTGVSTGTVRITASGRATSASIELRVVGSGSGSGGGGEGGLGNNLSTPLIFAEGVGVTGLPVDEDTGLRPTESEAIDVTVNPFWFDGNEPDCGYTNTIYYCQQGENTWRAGWQAALAGQPRSAAVQWGDNLTHHAFNTHTPLRVEVRLYDRNATMPGFSMPYAVGSGPDEMQGTDGTLVDLQPTIFAVTPRLVVQKLENYDEATGEGDVVATVYDAAIWQTLGEDGPGRFGAEVNVGGTLIYGYLLFIRDLVLPADVHKYGWWRLIVQLDDQGTLGGVSYLRNLSLDDLVVADESEDGEALLFTPKLDSAASATWLDIWVESASGGGGGGHSGDGTGEHSGG